jgi:mevalonate pyrophosphate decarboxylase
MSIEGKGRNRRESFRCAVADTSRDCALNVGSEMQQAKLLDESAGGFAVLVDCLVGLNIPREHPEPGNPSIWATL